MDIGDFHTLFEIARTIEDRQKASLNEADTDDAFHGDHRAQDLLVCDRQTGHPARPFQHTLHCHKTHP